MRSGAPPAPDAGLRARGASSANMRRLTAHCRPSSPDTGTNRKCQHWLRPRSACSGVRVRHWPARPEPEAGPHPKTRAIDRRTRAGAVMSCPVLPCPALSCPVPWKDITGSGSDMACVARAAAVAELKRECRAARLAQKTQDAPGREVNGCSAPGRCSIDATPKLRNWCSAGAPVGVARKRRRARRHGMELE
jgi:hypothetical protein